MINLKHQTQPTENSCMSTCLAMVVGEDVQHIIDKYHDKLFDSNNDRFWYDTVLDDYNVQYMLGSPKFSRIFANNIYILSVPSLNVEGGLHAVVAVAGEGLTSREIVIHIYDPNQGYVDRKFYYYDNIPKSIMGVKLKSWSIDVIIPLANNTLGFV